MRPSVFAVVVYMIASFLGSSEPGQEPPVPIEIAIPRYPLSAFVSNTSGEVEVEVSLDATGKVTTTKALSGPYSLRPASEKAATKWRFQMSTDRKSRQAKLLFEYKRQSKDEPATGLGGIYKPPYRVEVIGEEESTVILADPPVEIGKPKKSKNK
jgi:hypothetical protein